MKRLFRWAIDKEKERKVEVLQKVNLFNGLRRNLLMKLLVDLIEKEYPSGEVIFAEGDIGKALYIILDGSVTITKRCGDDETVLAELRSGEYFGELALIDHMPRYASARTSGKTTLLIMYRSYFDDLTQRSNTISSRILLNLVGLLSAYIRQKNEENR
jgi:CRP-like cAMP-binding protein